MNIYITSDSIEFDDFSHSIYKIRNKIDIKNDEILEAYSCQDKNGIICNFIIALDENKNKYYLIDYSNVGYFYYTKL